MGAKQLGLTLPPIYVIKISRRIFVCTIASFTEETRLTWTSSSGVFNNHSFI